MSFLVFLSLLIVFVAFVFLAMLLVLFFGLNMIYVNITTAVPWARVPQANLEQILAEINLAPGSLLYDLGCGDGRFLFIAEEKGFKAVGYELSLYPYLKTLASKFIKNSRIQIRRQDFFKQDLGAADAVFIFLTGSVMAKIGLKLKQDLKEETKVISYGFLIPGWSVKKILDTHPSKTYIY